MTEIAEHSLGKMLDKRKNKGSLRDYLRNTNVRWFEFDLSDLKQMRFTDGETSKFTARNGDVLICEGGYPGRAAIWESDEPIYIQKAVHRVRFHELNRNRWFVYYLFYLDLTGKLAGHFTGSGIQHFTGQALAKLRVPLPPLGEQERIVGILDEAFAAIATAVAHTQKNLTHARELFENHVDQFFSEHRNGWKELELSEIADFKNGLNYTKTSRGERIAIVGVKDFQSNFHVPTEDLESVQIDGNASDDFLLRNGDIVVVRSNGNRQLIGRAVLLPNVAGRVSHSGFTIRIRLNTEAVTPAFLTHYLKSQRIRQLMTKGGGGINISSLNQTTLAQLPIAFPSIDEQNHLVSQFETTQARCSQFVAMYERKLVLLAELKQSLLHRAFTGQL